jgi:hypothetical protein
MDGWMNLFGIADNLPQTTTNVSILCFIGPHDNTIALMEHIKEDREILDLFYNYTKLVNDKECVGPEENYTICVDVIESLKWMTDLKGSLDKIISGEREEEDVGSGGKGEVDNDDSSCWNTSPQQQHWVFNSLGTFMDSYVKQDLQNLKNDLIKKK